MLNSVATPETKHPRRTFKFYGKETSAFTKMIVEVKDIGLSMTGR